MIIIIEPLEGFRTKEFRYDSRCVYMTKCKGLKIKPFAKIRRTGITAKHYILMTDAILALPVDCRLIGCDHSWKKRLRI